MSYGRYNPARRRTAYANAPTVIPAGYRPVFGNTFPVKDQLKALGAKWDGDRKLWHVPAAAYDAAVALVAPPPAAAAPAPAPAPTVDLSAVVSLLYSAKSEELKYPKVSLVGPNGRILNLNLASERSSVPGAINVLMEDEWLGRVTKTGEVHGKLARNVEVVSYLNEVASSPDKLRWQAKLYAQRTSACSFCHKRLDDEGSIEVGYGPKCAQRYGLPHKPKGRAKVEEVPVLPADSASLATVNQPGRYDEPGEFESADRADSYYSRILGF